MWNLESLIFSKVVQGKLILVVTLSIGKLNKYEKINVPKSVFKILLFFINKSVVIRHKEIFRYRHLTKCNPYVFKLRISDVGTENKT